jgi:Holliday junction resolvase RusA-like endonuclease
MIALSLPLPPLGNHRNGVRIVRGKPRFFPTLETKAFHRTVALAAKQMGAKPLPAPVVVTVTVYRARAAGDIDGYLKVLLDSLEGVAYENDSAIHALSCELVDGDRVPRVEVRVARLETPSANAPDDAPEPSSATNVVAQARRTEAALSKLLGPPARPTPAVWRPPSKHEGGK